MGRDTLAGFIYGMVHPDWPGYVKIGRAKNPNRRLRDYNIGDPKRAYSFAFVLGVPDCTRAELQAHRCLRGCRVANTEWFEINPEDALALLSALNYSEVDK